MRRLVAAAAVAALAVTTLAGCYEGNPNGPRVAVVGDSISWLAQPWIRWELAVTHRYAYQFRVLPGMQAPWGAYQLSRLDSDPQGPPQYVVWEFGTNDAAYAPGDPVANFTWAFEHELQDRACVVLVNVSTAIAHPFIPNEVARMQELNRAYAFVAWVDPHVRLVDWNRLSRSRPGLRWPGGNHPSGAGAQVLARAIVRQLAGCPPP